MKIKDLLKETKDRRERARSRLVSNIVDYLENHGESGEYNFNSKNSDTEYSGKVHGSAGDIHITLSLKGDILSLNLAFEEEPFNIGSMMDDDDNPEAAELKAKLAKRKPKPKMIEDKTSENISGRTVEDIAESIDFAVQEMFIGMRLRSDDE